MESEMFVSRNRFKRMRSLAACGVIVGALLVSTGSAVDAAPFAEGAATPASKTTALACGYQETPHPNGEIYYTSWTNCGDSSEQINVDTVLWPDFEKCVRAHSTLVLGEGGSRVSDVRGATYLWSGCSPTDN